MAQTVNVRLSVLMHDELVAAAELLHVANHAFCNKDLTEDQRVTAVHNALHSAMVALCGCHEATHIVVLKADRPAVAADREIIVKNNKIVEERPANAAMEAK